MKKFLTTILFFAITLGLSAQNATEITANDPVVKKFTQAYDLNSDQVEKMITIQERRIRNLAEIEGMRDTNNAVFHQKRKAINKGTETSVLMMLNEEQRTAFRAALLVVREQKAVKRAKLKETGMTYLEVENQLIDVDDSMY